MKMKICSTWNNMKILPCILTAFILFCNSLFSFPIAYAAPAVAVPVGAELIGELLVALGLMTGNATDGYIWKANDNPYTSSIFENQIAGITSGVPVASETLGQLKNSVIPDDVYTVSTSSDGVPSFYVGEKKLTTSDIFLSAKSLAGVSYKMPINVDGAQAFLGFDWSIDRVIVSTPVSDISSGGDFYFVPYYLSSRGSSYILPQCLHFSSPTSSILYDYLKGYESKAVNFSNVYSNLSFSTKFGQYIYLTDNLDGYSAPNTELNFFNNPNTGWSGFQVVSGSGGDFSGNALNSSYISSGTLLRTTGKPILELQGDKESLNNAIVQVKSPQDDDDNKTPPVPQSPNTWEIWKSFEDLIRFIDTGEVTNGGTDYQQFVNNNYNYVDVDINVPDTINNNVNISGGLDVNTSGSVDITIHEDISLPSAGNGSGFYNPNVVDVIGALGKDNPVTAVVSGLFSALDPALFGIFSVSVSLLFVLGLWKLIRG